MVNYKVRAFYEKDSGSVGADVVIYSDTGDVIDTILVTTQGQYNQLISRLDGIDDTYMDLNELKEVLKNTGDSLIEINATKFNGYGINDFSRYNHKHDDLYAPLSHAKNTVDHGVGTGDKYGHNKVVDNCLSSQFNAGESLSANQGRVLNEKIDSAISSRGAWISLSTGSYGTLFVNNAIRLAHFRYYHSKASLGTGGNCNYDKIPGVYCPKQSTIVPAMNPTVALLVKTDGNIEYSSTSAGTKTIHASAMWPY